MNHDEFLGQVQHRAHLPDRGRAQRAVRATLETLAERISDGAAGNLAAQLPIEVAEPLWDRAAEGGDVGEQFAIDEFFSRVAAREHVDMPDAVFHAHAVLEVIDEGTTGQLLTKIREQLPGDYDRLFDEDGANDTSPGG